MNNSLVEVKRAAFIWNGHGASDNSKWVGKIWPLFLNCSWQKDILQFIFKIKVMLRGSAAAIVQERVPGIKAQGQFRLSRSAVPQSASLRKHQSHDYFLPRRQESENRRQPERTGVMKQIPSILPHWLGASPAPRGALPPDVATACQTLMAFTSSSRSCIWLILPDSML